MNKIEVTQVPQFTSPNPFTLVCTEMPDGDTNLAAICWWTHLSMAPATIGVAMGKTSYSGERLLETKRVLLAMPGAQIADAAFACGTASGRNKKKATEFGIEMTEVPGTTIKAPVCSRVVLDCQLTQTIEVGDHNLYICTVNAAYGDESKEPVFAWEGYGSVRPMK